MTINHIQKIFVSIVGFKTNENQKKKTQTPYICSMAIPAFQVEIFRICTKSSTMQQ